MTIQTTVALKSGEGAKEEKKPMKAPTLFTPR
jgi:hypothetical protein